MYRYNLHSFESVRFSIEHLEADVLAALPATLFGYMRPRLVVLTTPNQEFNQLFPDFSGMRHWDHKFEWTRAEFQSWFVEKAAAVIVPSRLVLAVF